MCIFVSFTVAARPQNGLDLRTLDPTVQYFCERGIASTTIKTYQSALCRFANFCSNYNVLTPFPVSESLLCYYASYLATDKLSPQTIKVYLVAICHVQITMGLPELQGFSSLPRLRLVQAGIKQTHATQVSSKVRLPITLAILLGLKDHWSPQQTNNDILMIWAAATLCFFGFFCLGEITVPTEKGFDSTKHLQ